jgi:carbon monoxide dehydrogenase subunit G
MFTVESKKVNVSKSATEVFDFLADLNNLQKLIPADKMDNWRSTKETCRFTIKNLSTIGMKHKELVSPSKIILESDGKNPFDFTLSIFVSDKDGNTESNFVFEGDANMFMATMVKAPLKKFFDVLAENLDDAMA